LGLSAPGVHIEAAGPDESVELSYTHTGPASFVELVVSNSLFNRGTRYSLDLHLNAIHEASLPTTATPIGSAMDLQAAFLTAPGSALQIANIIGQGRIAPTLEAFGNVYQSNQLRFSFDGLPAPTGVATLTVTALADLGSYQEALQLRLGSTILGYLFGPNGSDHSTVTEQVTLDQALIEAALVDGTLDFTVVPYFGVEDLGLSELLLSLSYPGIAFDPTDSYAVELEAEQMMTVMLDSEPDDFMLELVDAATGSVLIQPTAAEGFDALLRDWSAPAAGTYLLRVTAQSNADYHLSIARNGVIHSVPGVPTQQPVPLSDEVDTAIGYLRASGAPRLFATQGNLGYPYATETIIELDPVTLEPINQFTVGGAPGVILGGVNALAYAGGVLYAGILPNDGNPPGPGKVYALDPDTGELIGSFSTASLGPGAGFQLAAYGDELILDSSGGQEPSGGIIGFVDPISGLLTRQINTPAIAYPLSIAGAPDRGTLFLSDYGNSSTTNVYEVDAMTGALINTLVLTQGHTSSIAYLNGRLVANSRNLDLVSAYDPDTGTLLESVSYPYNFLTDVGGDGVSPDQDTDRYTLNLQAGQRVTLSTSTPFDHPSNPTGSAIDPALRVLDPNGVAVAFNANGAPDGKNATITFTASAGGAYTIEVSAESGHGEYVLHISHAPFLAGDLTGDGFVGIEDLNTVLGNWNQNVASGNLAQGDASGDGFVGIEDLNTVLGNWNATLEPPAVEGDLNSDGFVGIADLNVVLGNWNQSVIPSDLTQGDPSGDGFVGIEDLNTVLGNWNTGIPAAVEAFTLSGDEPLAEASAFSADETTIITELRHSMRNRSSDDTGNNRSHYIHNPSVTAAWDYLNRRSTRADNPAFTPWSLRPQEESPLIGLWEEDRFGRRTKALSITSSQ
jgi:hypothetical protein